MRMTLSLKQSLAVGDLAQSIVDLLPGTPHPYADQSVSFAGVANDLGLGRFWSGGTKLPAVTRFLSETLEQRPQDFSKVLVEIVRRGIGYRANRNNSVTRGQIKAINDLIAEVGFKIPDLIDPAFVDRLPRDETERPGQPTPIGLDALIKMFGDIGTMDPQPRGYVFEKFLNGLFQAYGLAPREPFRLVGEQIDGSFQLDGDTYLVEARWRNEQADEAALSVLSAKVAGKAQWSRGLFVSYSGFSKPGLDGFARGKPTNVICVDGLDLHHFVADKVDVAEAIRRKARRAAETNEAFVPLRDLFDGIF